MIVEQVTRNIFDTGFVGVDSVEALLNMVETLETEPLSNPSFSPPPEPDDVENIEIIYNSTTAEVAERIRILLDNLPLKVFLVNLTAPDGMGEIYTLPITRWDKLKINWYGLEGATFLCEKKLSVSQS